MFYKNRIAAAAAAARDAAAVEGEPALRRPAAELRRRARSAAAQSRADRVGDSSARVCRVSPSATGDVIVEPPRMRVSLSS